MATSLSIPVDNLTEGTHKIKFKDCDCFLEYEIVKDNLIKYKCLSCNKSYSNKIDVELKNDLRTYLRFNNDMNKFILLSKKGIYPYEYMDHGEKFTETTLNKKDEFYSKLNMKDITDADYMHAKRVCKDFEIKQLDEYHDMYLT